MLKCLTGGQEPLFKTKYLLSSYYVPDILGAGDTAVIKIDINPFPYGAHGLVVNADRQQTKNKTKPTTTKHLKYILR